MNRKNKNYNVELWRAYNKQFGKIFSAAGATQKKPRQAAETLQAVSFLFVILFQLFFVRLFSE